MNNVDERVVKMTFDNKEFENNARETMSTLEKLKQSLNFKGAFDNMSKASNSIDLSGIKDSLGVVQTKFSAMQIVGYTAISNLTNRLLNFAYSTVKGTFSQVVQGGINRAFNIEKAKFTIEGLGKDWKELSKNINEAVTGTAYGFDEAAVAASSLAASNVKAGKEMERALSGIAGMAAMTGSSFSDISNIFTTVAGNGRLLSQQLNQFSARGLNAAATLRDYINSHQELKKELIDKALKSSMAKEVKEFQNANKLTEGNIRKLVSASVVDFKTFSDAMTDAFGDQAKAANKTFNGVISNIKASLSRIGAAFAQPLIANNDIDNMLDMVNTKLRNAIDKTKKIASNTKESKKSLYDSLKSSGQFSTKLIETLKKTKEYSKKTTEEIRDAYKKDPDAMLVSVKKLKDYSKVTKKDLKELFSTTTKDLRTLYKQNPKDFLAQVQKIEGYSDMTGGKLKKLMRTTKEEFIHQMKTMEPDVIKALKKTKDYSGKTAQEIIDAYKKNPKEMLKTVKKLDGYQKMTDKELKNVMKLSSYTTMSDKKLGKLYDKYYNVQHNLVGVLQGVMRVFKAVEAKITGSKFLKSFLKTSEKVSKELILLFNGLSGEINGITKKHKKFIEIVGEKKHLVAVDKIWERLRKNLGLSKTDWGNLLNTLKGIGSIFGLLKHVIKTFLNVFIPTKKETKTFTSELLKFTSGVSDLIQGFAKWVKSSGIVKNAMLLVKNILSGLIKVVGKVFGYVSKIFKSIVKSKSSFLKVVDSVVELFKALNRLRKIITDQFAETFDKIFSLIFDNSDKAKNSGSIFEKAIDVICTALSWFIDLVTGFVNGLADFLEKFNVFEVVGNVLIWVSDLIFNKAIPAFKDFYNWIKKIGGGAFKGLADVVTENAGKVKEGVANIIDGVKGESEKIDPKDIFEKVGKTFEDGFDAIKNFDYEGAFDKIEKGFEDFTDFLENARKSIGTAYDKIKAILEEKNINFESIGEKVQKGFDNAFNVIIDNTPKAVKVVGKVIKNAFKTIRDALPEPKDIATTIADFVVTVLESVADFIPWFIETLSMTIQIIANDLGGIIEKLVGQINEIITKAFTGSFTIGKGADKRTVASISDSLTNTIKSAAEKINWDLILKTIKTIVNAKLALNAGSFFKSGAKLFDTVSNAINNIIGGIQGDKRHEQKIEELKAKADLIKNIAIAIGVFAGALIILGLIPTDKLMKGLGFLTIIIGLMVVLVGVLEGIEIVSEKWGGGDIDRIVKSVASLAKGISKLVFALVLLALIPFKEGAVENALAQVFVLLSELALFVFAVSKIQPDSLALEATGSAVESIGKGIMTLVKAIAILSFLDPEKSWNAILQVAAMLFALAGAIKVLNGATSKFDAKSLVSVLPIILLLGSIVAALYLINKYQLEPEQIGWIIGAVGVLTACSLALNSLAGMGNWSTVLQSLVMVLPIILMLGAIVAALVILKTYEIDPSSLGWISLALVSLAVVIGVLGLIGTANPAAGALAAAQIIEFVTVLGVALVAIGALAHIPGVSDLIGDAGALLKKIGEALSQIVVGFIEGCKSAIQSLMGLEVDETQVDKISKVGDLLAKLAEVQLILEKGGGKILTFFAGDQPFTKFGNGVVNLFESFNAVGESAGKIKNVEKIKTITQVASTLAKMVEILKDPKGLGEVLNLVGENKLATLGEQLVAFGTKVQEYVDSFKNLDLATMSDATTEISKSINKLAKASSKKSFTKGFASTGGNAVQAITSGFAGSSTKIAKALNSEIKAAMDAIKTDKFKEKGEFCIKAFKSGLEKTKDVKAAAKNAGGAAADAFDDSPNETNARTAGTNVLTGFRNGLGDLQIISSIKSRARSIGKLAVDEINAGAGNGSPSKLTRKSGIFVDQGFINGILYFRNKVGAAAETIGKEAANSIKRSTLSLNNLVNDSFSDPVIRPVLDLSNVKMGVNSLNSMMSNSYALGIAGTMPFSNVQSARNITFNNRITVDGTSDPSEWADEFMQELEIQARTL